MKYKNLSYLVHDVEVVAEDDDDVGDDVGDGVVDDVVDDVVDGVVGDWVEKLVLLVVDGVDGVEVHVGAYEDVQMVVVAF